MLDSLGNGWVGKAACWSGSLNLGSVAVVVTVASADMSVQVLRRIC